jgi:hypothetical protein
VASGAARLADAANPALAPESRFALAYNAAHALALAALRYRGYRSDNRYVVFQALPHTLGVPAAMWRVLAKGHERRNLAEYEGALDVDDFRLAASPVLLHRHHVGRVGLDHLLLHQVEQGVVHRRHPQLRCWSG